MQAYTLTPIEINTTESPSDFRKRAVLAAIRRSRLQVHPGAVARAIVSVTAPVREALAPLSRLAMHAASVDPRPASARRWRGPWVDGPDGWRSQ